MLRKWLLLTLDPAEGGNPANTPATPAAPPAGDGAPPPFADAAAAGKKTERELELERQLKAREMDIASLQDQKRTESERAKALEQELAKRNQPPAPPTPDQEETAWGFFGRRN